MLSNFVITILIYEIESFVLKDSYNILLKDNTEYKIDEPINNEDYEVVRKEQLAQFNADKETILYILHKLASKNYEKETIRSTKLLHGTEQSIPIMTENFAITTTPFLKQTTHVHSNRDNIIDDETEYNYDNLLKEYYDDSSDYVCSNETYRAKIKGKSQSDLIYSVKSIFHFDSWTSNCTEELKHIGFKAIYCLLEDYTNGVTPRLVLVRLWRIVKIWIGVYIFIAVPLWCTRGWCCCCLLCKFFKPRQTIDEAKRYFVANPPGVLRGANQEDVLYEPTDNERDAYEEFEHLIRTI